VKATISPHAPQSHLWLMALPLVLTTFYLFLVAREYRAAAWSHSTDIAGMRKAVEIQPRNAETQLVLARMEAEALQSPELALERLRRAEQLDPYNAAIHLQLAAAERMSGNSVSELAALQRALAVDPLSQATVWEAANTYLAEGQTAKALEQFRVIIANDPQLRASALNITWRATRDSRTLMRLLPPDADAHLLLLNLLWHAGDDAGARQTWAKLVALRQAIEPQAAFGYLQDRIERRDVEMARQVWLDLAEIDPAMREYMSHDGNLLSNPGFEYRLLNGGLGWRYWSNSGVELAVDPGIFHTGTHALKLKFNGAPNGGGIEQYLVVKPNTRYRFSAFVRTDALESASPPRFAIVDAYDARTSYLLTDEWPAGHDWYEQDGEFTTGPASRLLVLRIVRQDNSTQVRGSAWLDDLSLRERN
jgi:tetratricopeptide (TPR) repeat protein